MTISGFVEENKSEFICVWVIRNGCRTSRCLSVKWLWSAARRTRSSQRRRTWSSSTRSRLCKSRSKCATKAWWERTRARICRRGHAAKWPSWTRSPNCHSQTRAVAINRWVCRAATRHRPPLTSQPLASTRWDPRPLSSKWAHRRHRHPRVRPRSSVRGILHIALPTRARASAATRTN